MRYCAYCTKAMFTSNHSIWIGKVNFEVHKECENKFIRYYKKLKEKENE